MMPAMESKMTEVAWLSSDNYVVTQYESVGQTLHGFQNRAINCMNKLFKKCITPGRGTW
jgi:hypothetical protein